MKRDPLAQSFFIEEPTYVTKVDLFFSAKDTKIPFHVELRKMTEDGLPSQYVIPFSQKTTTAQNVNISDNASVATTVYFDSPVYLEAGYYALVLLADTTNYRVWISEMGETDLLTSKTISKQPNLGVLFKSQNAYTWSPFQFQDLKFKLYRAKFDANVTASIDLVVDMSALDHTTRSLAYNSFELFPNSTTMRIYHENHGLENGSKARIRYYTCPLTSTGNLSNVLFGIQEANIRYVAHTVSNATQNFYTINLNQTPDANISKPTLVGEGFIVVEDNLKYETLYPSIATITPTGTSIDKFIKTTASGTYNVDASFIRYNDGDINFSSSRVIPSNVNFTTFMSNVPPLTIRLNLSTTDDRVAPLIDIQKCSATFARNLVYTPSYDTENLVYDKVTIANATNISFQTLTTNTTSTVSAYILLTNAADKANAASIPIGSQLIVTSNVSVNSGTYRVLGVENNGGNILVFGNIVTQPSGNLITIVNGNKYIEEEAPYYGSAASKYITRQVNFTNPSTSLLFRLDTIKPPNSNLKFYYKTRLVGETTPLESKEFIEITGITIPDSISGEFYEIEKQLDNLPMFDALVFKIVFLSTNPATPPKCRKLRIIALA